MQIPHLNAGLATMQDLQAVEQAIRTVSSNLSGKLPALTPEERQRYGSINESNKLIVQKVADLLDMFPQLTPSQIDATTYNQMLKDYEEIDKVVQLVESEIYKLSNWKIIQGYNLYASALAYYDYVGYLAKKTSDSDAQKAHEELKPFFVRPRKSKPKTDAADKKA